ncbi:hypothetical protein BJY59DRAFT_192918 [Rhodotorula toruloides]
MFDQLARVLHEANIPLPPRVVKVITSERSVFVDEKDESKGLAPLHEQLPDAVIDQLFSRPVALFVCSNSTCLNKSYPDILAHVASSHPWSEPDNVSCVSAGAEYLKLIDTMLDEANLDRLNTTSQDLKRLGGRFAVTLRDGSVKRNVSWTGVVRAASRGSIGFANASHYRLKDASPTGVSHGSDGQPTWVQATFTSSTAPSTSRFSLRLRRLGSSAIRRFRRVRVAGGRRRTAPGGNA